MDGSPQPVCPHIVSNNCDATASIFLMHSFLILFLRDLFHIPEHELLNTRTHWTVLVALVSYKTCPSALWELIYCNCLPSFCLACPNTGGDIHINAPTAMDHATGVWICQLVWLAGLQDGPHSLNRDEMESHITNCYLILSPLLSRMTCQRLSRSVVEFPSWAKSSANMHWGAYSSIHQLQWTPYTSRKTIDSAPNCQVTHINVLHYHDVPLTNSITQFWPGCCFICFFEITNPTWSAFNVVQRVSTTCTGWKSTS